MVHITMIKLTDQQIKEIAENLDCGMRCFYNKQSGEIKTLLVLPKVLTIPVYKTGCLSL